MPSVTNEILVSNKTSIFVCDERILIEHCRKLGKSVLGVEKEIDNRTRNTRNSSSASVIGRPRESLCRESWMFNCQLTPSAPLIECHALDEEEPPPSYKQEKLSYIL